MLKWFDLYGLDVFFCVNGEWSYRTKMGTILTLINIVLFTIFMSMEFTER